jgi:hypothetical protein
VKKSEEPYAIFKGICIFHPGIIGDFKCHGRMNFLIEKENIEVIFICNYYDGRVYEPVILQEATNMRMIHIESIVNCPTGITRRVSSHFI